MLTFLRLDVGRDVLNQVIVKHVALSVMHTSNIEVGSMTVTPMDDSELILTRATGGEISLEGASFASSDMLALNGVVHVINNVLLPHAWSADMFVPTSNPSPPPIVQEPLQDCFQCPLNSVRIDSTGCSGTIDECRCLQGYIMLNDECEFCNYECPWNASPLPDLDCISSLRDCECNSGYVWDGSECVPGPTGCGEFQCPPNSSAKPFRLCYNTFDDCECDEGYSRGQSKCY
jgi:hypothetical protein